MEETDDIKLLKECDAGVQMAISSIDEVLEKISDDQLKELLEEKCQTALQSRWWQI